MSSTSSKKQKPKKRRTSRLSVKTNDCRVEDVIQNTSIVPMGTVEQPDTEKEGRGQDEGFAVPCSLKIVPTFRKQKRAEKKVCQDENGIPTKHLKAAGKYNNRSNIDITVQLHNQDKSTVCDPPINTTNTIQSIKEQCDQSNTEQTAESFKNIIKPILERVTVTQGYREQEPISGVPVDMEVTEQKDQIEDLTKKDLPKVKVDSMKDHSLQGNKQLNTELTITTKMINSNSEEQSECDKEPLNRCHNKCNDIGEKTVTVKELEEHGSIQNIETNYGGLHPNMTGAEKPTEPKGHPIDINLKSKVTGEHICDEHPTTDPGCILTSQMASENHSKIIHKDTGIIEDINNHSICQKVEINYENQNQSFLLTNNTNNSLECTTDQIRKPSMNSIPTLQTITTRVIEQHEGKLEPPTKEKDQVKPDSRVVKQGSYCIPGLQTITTGSEEVNREGVNKTRQVTVKSCGLEAEASSRMDRKDLSATETKMEKNTKDTGTEADVIPNLTTDRGSKTFANLTLDQTSVEGVDAQTHDMNTIDNVEAETHGMSTAEGMEIETHCISTVEGAEEITDSQLCAITTMDWTEEPLRPSKDTGRGHNSKKQTLPPSIPDGTAIVKGLIRDVSNLNMMLLRAKREMQTANQRKLQTPINDNRVNTWAKK